MNEENKELNEEAAQPETDDTVTLGAAEYEKLVREAAEYKDKYVRLLAEFENVRKRFDRDKIEFVKFANEGLISEFLGVMDDLERTMHAAKENHQDYAAFLKGIELVMAHIRDLLKKHHVKPIDAVGKKFDPHSHEILLQEPSEAEEGTVLEELQKGYLLGDRVVRTAKVKVAVQKEH